MEKTMQEQTTTTTEAPAKTSQKDDFVLATESQSAEPAIEPVETPAAAAATETEEEIEIEEPEEIDEPEVEIDASKKDETNGKKKKGGFQRRVDKLTREKADAQRELEMARAENAALKLQKEKPVDDKTAKPTPDVSKEPKEEDFAEVKDYYKALAKYEVQQEQKAIQAKQREDAVRKEMADQRQTHLDRMKDFEKSHSDFNDVMENIRNVNAHQDIHDAIMSSEVGPALMYELGQKPEEFAKIVAMKPVDAVRAIGKMEAKLEAASSAGKVDKPATEVPAKKVTTAPKPISTIQSKAGHIPSTRDDLPYEDWKKLREAELRGR
jgi:hypothetical protein